jgi:hypothetical protein
MFLLLTFIGIWLLGTTIIIKICWDENDLAFGVVIAIVFGAVLTALAVTLGANIGGRTRISDTISLQEDTTILYKGDRLIFIDGEGDLRAIPVGEPEYKFTRENERVEVVCNVPHLDDDGWTFNYISSCDSVVYVNDRRLANIS